MAKSLRERQSEFASKVPMLINKALELGYEVTLGDAYRDPRLHGNFGERKGYGESKSFHKLRLAIDIFNLVSSDILRLAIDILTLENKECFLPVEDLDSFFLVSSDIV